MGLTEIADSLGATATRIGELQTLIALEEGNIESIMAEQEEINTRVEALKASTSSDSMHRRSLDLIQTLLPLLEEYRIQSRKQLAEPLQEQFAEGFKMLSRSLNASRALPSTLMNTPSTSHCKGSMAIGCVEIFPLLSVNT